MAGDLRSPFDQDRMELLEKIGRLQGVEDYDTILRLGVVVPNIGTVEFEERVRRLRRDLPILYMSAIPGRT